MTTSNIGPRSDHAPVAAVPHNDADRAYRRAWWSLAFFPVSFVLAFVIGEGLFSMLTDGEVDPAVWKVLLSGLPALVVLVLPGVLAVHQGRQARRLGRRDGLIPAMVGGAIALGVVGLNAVSYLLILLVE
ncbi:hypothetical protein LL946_08185 [Knoellia locipacati]|uniref:hypothetical protein n=1 Tax=Knoellia locipacati TaxID=882824 RepID=UPI003850388C